MSKGYVYIMTSVVDGIIKIGRSENWKNRCAGLEENGYKNMNGLKTYFVIKVDNMEDVENTMHNIFKENCVINSKGIATELFACDKDRAKNALSKMGEQVYPEENNNTVKTKTKIKTKNETDTTIYNYNFWSALDKELDKYSILPKNKSNVIPNRSYYLTSRLNLNKTGWHVGFSLDRKRGNVINIDVETFNPNSFNHYDIYKSHKNEIEKELGFSLHWDYKFEGVNTNLKKHIIYFVDADFNTIDKEVIKNVADIAVKMYTTFLKYS